MTTLRLNIQQHIGIEANPIDILLMAGGRKSQCIVNNLALYKDKVREVFCGFSEENGDWFNVFESWNYDKKPYPHLLFNGAVVPKNPAMEFPIYAYYSAYKKLDVIRTLAKQAENLTRKEIGVPQIGEGWISETTLFRSLESEFSATTVIQHGQPKWLGRQHFDIWFPNWKIAVEYHGEQHFEPVAFFGGDKSFEKTVERDSRKIELAKENDVHLIVVTAGYDLSDLIQKIYSISSKRKIMLPTA